MSVAGDAQMLTVICQKRSGSDLISQVVVLLFFQNSIYNQITMMMKTKYRSYDYETI